MFEIVTLNEGFIQIIKYLMGFLQERLETIIDSIFNPVEITLLFYIFYLQSFIISFKK